MIKIAPFGSWKSPITADLTASSSIRIGDVQVHGDNVYWSEMRPDEQGRNVVMEYSDKGINNITPSVSTLGQQYMNMGEVHIPSLMIPFTSLISRISYFIVMKKMNHLTK